MLRVYLLVWNTWCNGQMGDFALPRTIGYFSSEVAARRVRNEHIDTHTLTKDTFTTEEDYSIVAVNVED